MLQLLKLPDGTVRVLVEGKERAKLLGLESEDKAVIARVAPIADTLDDSVDTAAQMRSVVDQFESYAKLNRSEEHTSELQSLMRTSYAGFRLKKKRHQQIAAN